MKITAKEILGNENYPAISYGGYRTRDRYKVPTINQIKEDLQILYAAGFRVLRTFEAHTSIAKNLLQAIKELDIEMYVMLGAWINAKDANTVNINHDDEDYDFNKYQIDECVRLANQYNDIVKMIAVGNESMAHFALNYYTSSDVILKWVNHLQQLKNEDKLDKDLYVTSSDDYTSWNNCNKDLLKAVDFISMHVYPFHYISNDSTYSDIEKSIEYVKEQYFKIKQLTDTPIHIGETGWATKDNYLHKEVANEINQKMYYEKIKKLSNELSISCFYFSAFDEPWKQLSHADGFQNHYGLFTFDGRAKFALWKMVDENKFKKLGRGIFCSEVTKTYDGKLEWLNN